MLRASVAILVFALTVRGAAADDVVVFGTDAPPREAFVQALAVQLSGDAKVAVGPILGSTALAGRIGEAVTVLRARSSRVGVWLDPVPGELTFDLVIYAVGYEDDIALVKVTRIAVTEHDDVERALALKVGELLEQLLMARELPTVARSLETARSGPVASAAAVAVAPSPPSSRGWATIVDLAGTLAGRSRGVQLAPSLGAGVRWDLPMLSIETLVSLRVPGTRVDDRERVVVGERAYVVAARAFAELGPLEIGGFALGMVRDVEAIGSTVDGRRGSEQVLLPALGIGVEARHALTSRADLRAAVGVEIAGFDQEFTLDGMPVVGLGRTRVLGELSLVIPVH